jgi:hypothetical protein
VAFAVAALAAVLAITIPLGMRHTAHNVVYATDDAYIHLSIARNLVTSGVWGINRGEFAGASSSPLWTLLLSLGMRIVGPANWLPLLLNCLAAGFATVAAWRLLREFMSGPWAAVLAVLIAIAAGMPLLVISGMEHPLQIALVFYFLLPCLQILDLGVPVRAGRVIAALCCAALLVATRFEGLFIAAAACLLLLLNRRWLSCMAVAIGAWTPVALYAAFSIRHGGDWLPNSVLLKGSMPPHSIGALALFALHGMATIARAVPLCTLVLANLVLLAFPVRRADRLETAARHLVLLFLIATLLHGELAMTGWFSRYEAYLVAAGTASACAVVAAILRESHLARGPRLYVASMLLAVLAAGPLVRGLVCLHRATFAPQNIYEQQVQMGRLTRAIEKPVAVNDIGAVSWLGGQEVVDLWGLASREVFLARRRSEYRPSIMRRVSDEHGASVAIVYDSWFTEFGGVPASWRKISSWTIPNNVAAGGPTVSIYQIHHDDDGIARQVHEFSQTQLPQDVRVEDFSR